MADNQAENTRPGQDASRLLTMLMIGRDDDYMPDFRYRIATTINYAARSLGNLGRLDDVEILVVDWGSEVPLAKTLPLTPDAGRICRFIYVPVEVIRKIQEGGEDFHTALTVNIGLRRASGRFVMLLGADTLLPRYSFEALLKMLGGELPVPVDIDRTYFPLSRSQVPWQFVARQPALDEWDRYLFLNTCQLERNRRGLMSVSSGAGALMLSKELWHEFRGLDEKFRAWGGNDMELGLRLTQHHPWVELSSVGVSLFHMEHPPLGRRASILKHQKRNPPVHNISIQVNDENWGLGGYELEIQTPQKVVAADETAGSNAVLTGRDLKTESWSKSRPEILAELAGKEVRDTVMRVVKQFSTDRKKWKIDPADMYSLFLLSWYGLYHYPRRYLEFGVGRGYAAATVAHACPSVEVYGIDRWEGDLPSYPGYDVALLLKERISRNGYVRFINGDIGTGARRLRDSFVGPYFHDLVFVRGDLLGDELETQLNELVECLAPGGALVLTVGSARLFETLWDKLHARFPGFSYIRCRDRKTGMVLAASMKEEGGGSASDAERLFTAKFSWADTSRTMWRMRKLCSAMLQPARYPEYFRRVCRRTE